MILVISECFNPACRTKLHYLRDGKVIRLIHTESRGVRIEHFWLCGACYMSHDLLFDKNGVLSLVTKLSDESHKTHPELRWIEERLAS